MADWDADGDRLDANLASVLGSIVAAAAKRQPITLAVIKRWHRRTMADLAVPDPRMVGRFRGEPGLEACGVRIGSHVPTGSIGALVTEQALKANAMKAMVNAFCQNVLCI